MSLPKYIVKQIINPEATRLVNNSTKLLTKKLSAQTAVFGKVVKFNTDVNNVFNGTIQVQMSDGTLNDAILNGLSVGISSVVMIKNGLVING